MKFFKRFEYKIGFRQSFSAPGCPYDNAVAEAFFKFLKKEEVNKRRFSQIEEVKQSLFSYIEGYYNKKRPHEANGGLSPYEKEAEFWKKISEKFIYFTFIVSTLLTIIQPETLLIRKIRDYELKKYFIIINLIKFF